MWKGEFKICLAPEVIRPEESKSPREVQELIDIFIMPREKNR